MKLVTSWETLMWRAKELGDAKKSGDQARIDRAQAKLDEYRDICLKADEMILPYTRGSL